MIAEFFQNIYKCWLIDATLLVWRWGEEELDYIFPIQSCMDTELNQIYRPKIEGQKWWWYSLNVY